MQFNSYEFILFFFPITILLYFMANKLNALAGKCVLILASIYFYAHGRAEMLIYLGLSMVINYLSALLIKKFRLQTKWMLFLPVTVNIGLLLYFKYLNFAITNINQLFGMDLALKEIILPLGISFYTFQQIAYLVATSKGELENNDLIDYLAYILFFPKLVMGPITEPVDYIGQLNDGARKTINAHHIAVGIRLFSCGLLKKALLADTFAKAAGWVYGNLKAATAMDCILLMLFYTFEIYFDFSGYSDMATGAALMLNIDLPMNFDSPYKAVSIRDFWKRWHMSLTKFLTRYIYIPLGGSRKGIFFTYLNTMIVFLVSGLWHGANWTFILWGFLHGILSCADRIFAKAEERIFLPVRWLCTFLATNVLWLLFSAESVTQWKNILQKALFMQDTTISSGLIKIFSSAENNFIFDILHLNYFSAHVRGFAMLLYIIAACIICFIPENNYRSKEDLSVRSLLLSSFCFIWGLLCLGAESIFVYFGF